MTTENRLSRAQGGSTVRTGKTAREWAQIARDNGDLESAAAWEKAEREGWDDMHFDPVVRDQHNRDAEAWAGKKGLITNRRVARWESTKASG